MPQALLLLPRPLNHNAALLLVVLLLQVETCAAITVTVSGYAVSPSPAGLPASLTSSHTVCWYRHDGQASAKFDFQSCADPGGCKLAVC